MKYPLLLIASLALLANCGKSPQEKKADHTKATQQLAAMRSHLAAGRLDSALSRIKVAQVLYQDSASATVPLNGLVHQIKEAGSDSTVTDKLGRLSPEGLKALKRGDKIAYYDDADVNKYFLGKLKSRTPEWASLRKERARQVEKERKDAIVLKASALHLMAEARRDYAHKLQNEFLDRNLDIEVTTSGQAATKLKLKFVLFSNVWARKFEKEGFFTQWRDKGFAKVEITDGYDYDYVWTLN